MLKLNLPEFDCKLKTKAGVVYIHCLIRHKEIVLTPEEWVRQHFINFLIKEKRISPKRISVESAASYNKLGKRTDIIVWDDEMKPLLLAECKAPYVAIDEKVIKQIGIYNKTAYAKYLALTNGMVHYYFKNSKEGYLTTADFEI